MIPLPPKVKLVVGILLAGLLAAGGYWDKWMTDHLMTVPAWLPPGLSMLTFLEGFVTVPAAAAKRITDLTSKLAGLSAIVLLAGGLIVGGGVGLSACKGAQFPSLSKVETVVLEDLAVCGDTTACRVKMENDVAALIAQGLIGPEAGTDALVLVRDALQFLADMGVIPQSEVPKARAVLQVVRIKLAVPAPGDVPVGE